MNRQNMPSISFEYFPPKTPEAEKAFYTNVQELAKFRPKFMTVTYGAGGSTRDKTIEIAEKLHKEYAGIPIAAHLTYINSTREYLYGITDVLWDVGIRHIVALRGDLPKDLSWPLDIDANYFQNTSQFVAALEARHGFEITVGAYPEKHPDAPDMSADIDALRQKCLAGATQAITQFFFDNEIFYKFREECAKAGIRKPIYPGVLPIHDFKSMQRFAAKCAAGVPGWLQEKFEKLEGKPDEARKVAEEILIKQVTDLAANGVGHIHFYTLNKADITAQAAKALGHKPV